MRKILLWITSIFAIVIVASNYAMAVTTAEIYISCTVAPYGYTYEPVITAEKMTPGQNIEFAYITVDGMCNAPYPWILRVYTDNKNYQGLAGTIHNSSIPSGLIREGGGSLTLKYKLTNDPDWYFIQDINSRDYKNYFLDKDAIKSMPEPDKRQYYMFGIDPTNPIWVAGPDKLLYSLDDENYGDTTPDTPFKIQLAVDFPEKPNKAPRGKYSTKLIFEVISNP